MKTITKFIRIKFNYRNTVAPVILAIFFLMVIASCEEGNNGDPGDIYLSVVWNDDMPNIVDPGNTYIPPAFEWGRFYKSYPGTYMLYYEGVFWNGTTNAFYSWEIQYNLYENAGKPGGNGYDGDDGPDNFFTLICSPFGPYVDQYMAKSSAAGKSTKVSKIDDDTFILTDQGETYTLVATYKKVSNRDSTL